MQLTLVDKLLWAAGFLLNLSLLFVLLYRRRARVVPWFAAFIAFGTIRTITLFVTYRVAGRHHLYAQVYWWAAGIDFLLQVAVVFEVARAVFLKSGRWVGQARTRFLVLAAASPVLGLVMTYFMQPAARSALDAWDARANLFLTITICAMCSAVMSVSSQLGLGWRGRVLRFMGGLLVWSLAAFITGTLHSYWRTIDDFGKLEDTVAGVYQLVAVYWIVIFWLPEPEQAVVPAEALEDLNRFAGRLDYKHSDRV